MFHKNKTQETTENGNPDFLESLGRATLAEKEVSALKEQLAVANQSQGGEGKMAALAQGTEEIINRSSIELELSAKDKEDLYCDNPQSLKLKIASKRRNTFYQNKKQTTKLPRDATLPGEQPIEAFDQSSR
ncbi:hypothetical protein AAG570_008074 [Ranatra chinensis]|uniref:Uncharacterized protein n=1 Tax=Ranatra chinensis TaxID=642074 RepID=A0ABD0XTQ8_9HEMI